MVPFVRDHGTAPNSGLANQVIDNSRQKGLTSVVGIEFLTHKMVSIRRDIRRCRSYRISSAGQTGDRKLHLTSIGGKCHEARTDHRIVDRS